MEKLNEEGISATHHEDKSSTCQDSYVNVEKEEGKSESSSDEKAATPSENPVVQQNQPAGTKLSSVKYGELVVIGYNGGLPQGNRGRRRSKFPLHQRSEGNGVKPVRNHQVNNPLESELIQTPHQHSMSFTLSRTNSVIVQYDHDSELDMFQIGRGSDTPIDFEVLDTVPGDRREQDCVVTQSTISRYACRILVERKPPYTARIYAGGFDSGNNIFLGECATKWSTELGLDGLTTNGILIQHLEGGFSPMSKGGIWREVSVAGGIFTIRQKRSTPTERRQIRTEDNILRDGTMIDLCGVTLLWRSAVEFSTCKRKRSEVLDKQVEEINASKPLCPVSLTPLVLQKEKTERDNEKQPFVYLECGHVHGLHEWGKSLDSNRRTCPLCKSTGQYVKLELGVETSFYIDYEPPSHCFRPCGHMASERTIKFWATIGIPHGCQGFQAECPFCACLLTDDPGWVKVIFQDNIH